MATTMVAAAVHGDRVTIANVGDSRAYLIRGAKVEQITTDHTIAGEMLRYGEITPQEAQQMKGKNRITRSLGGEKDVKVDVFPDIPLRPGDKLLLCSDGLARYTLPEDLARLTAQGGPTDIAQRCVAYANQRGGSDNISVAVVEIGQPVEAGVVPSAGGTLPTQVVWDEMLTQPSVMAPDDGQGFRLTPLTVAVLAGAFIVAAGAIVIFVPRVLGYISGVEGTATVANMLPQEIEETLTPTIEILPTNTPEPTVTATEQFNTPSLESEQTNANGPNLQTAKKMGCLYEVTATDDQGLLSILGRFGFGPTESAQLVSEVINMDTGDLLPDFNDINPGDELFFPFIDSPEVCDLGNGDWTSVSLPIDDTEITQ
jgi:hypothetical protein